MIRRSTELVAGMFEGDTDIEASMSEGKSNIHGTFMAVQYGLHLVGRGEHGYRIRLYINTKLTRTANRRTAAAVFAVQIQPCSSVTLEPWLSTGYVDFVFFGRNMMGADFDCQD
jgi:hypothetical protein